MSSLLQVILGVTTIVGVAFVAAINENKEKERIQNAKYEEERERQRQQLIRVHNEETRQLNAERCCNLCL
jgi:hypothetical protein